MNSFGLDLNFDHLNFDYHVVMSYDNDTFDFEVKMSWNQFFASETYLFLESTGKISIYALLELAQIEIDSLNKQKQTPRGIWPDCCLC